MFAGAFGLLLWACFILHHGLPKLSTSIFLTKWTGWGSWEWGALNKEIILLIVRGTWMLVRTGILCPVKESWRWQSCFYSHVRGALKVWMIAWMKKEINSLSALQGQYLVHLEMNEGQLSLTPPVTPQKFTFHQQNQSQKKEWAAARSSYCESVIN